MDPFPHNYQVSAKARTEGPVALSSPKLEGLLSAPPAEFDGPGDLWSPETLLLAAVADCFTLSFRAVAAASRFEWIDLECSSTGTLDRVDRITRFTRIVTSVRLTVAPGVSEERSRRLLEKAEEVCLISNSLSADRSLQVEIVTIGAG